MVRDDKAGWAGTHSACLEVSLCPRTSNPSQDSTQHVSGQPAGTSLHHVSRCRGPVTLRWPGLADLACWFPGYVPQRCPRAAHTLREHHTELPSLAGWPSFIASLLKSLLSFLPQSLIFLSPVRLNAQSLLLLQHKNIQELDGNIQRIPQCLVKANPKEKNN